MSSYYANLNRNLNQVGFGDITADNSAERVGYVVFFIAGAFIWGKLLAELGDLHR